MDFTGRHADIRLLGEQLKSVQAGGAGKAVILSGRRRVGKSRLAQEFCDRSGHPYLVFQATRGRNAASERGEFRSAVDQSTLAGRDLIEGLEARDWNQTLRTLALAIPDDSPSIVVIDEVPWLLEQDTEFEGALQTEWDRHLSRKPVLLLLIGSDLSVMQTLGEYGRPFHGRAAHYVLRPLNAADVATMTGLAPADAVDAHLITGGFPEIVQSWRQGWSREAFLRASLDNPLSPLLMAGQLSLLSEFPGPTLSRAVIEAIGSGERTFSAVAAKAGGGGGLSSGSLGPLLNGLVAKHIVAVDRPLSAKLDDKNKRYRIADTYLRFWITFLAKGIAEAERGRPDLALARIGRSWTSWRGRAVEPWVRESLARLLPDSQWPHTNAIGGWWNRQNNPEVDLVGADDAPAASELHFIGSIKWQDSQPFSVRDYAKLVQDIRFIPGTDEETPLVAVSRSGVETGVPLRNVWLPADLIDAWR